MYGIVDFATCNNTWGLLRRYCWHFCIRTFVCILWDRLSFSLLRFWLRSGSLTFGVSFQGWAACLMCFWRPCLLLKGFGQLGCAQWQIYCPWSSLIRVMAPFGYWRVSTPWQFAWWWSLWPLVSKVASQNWQECMLGRTQSGESGWVVMVVCSQQDYLFVFGHVIWSCDGDHQIFWLLPTSCDLTILYLSTLHSPTVLGVLLWESSENPRKFLSLFPAKKQTTTKRLIYDLGLYRNVHGITANLLVITANQSTSCCVC